MDDRRSDRRRRRDKLSHKVARRLERGQIGQLPDFVIIGTQKGGTTSLYRYLTCHPGVGNTLRKEIHFFSWYSEKTLDWYRAHFPRALNQAVIGEASTSYLSDPDVPGRVRSVVPNAKLIAILRNPADRAYSQYQMNRRKGFESLPFEAAIAEEPERLIAAGARSTPLWRYSSYLTRGRYAEQLEWWLQVFPREQLLVLKSEHVFTRPAETLRLAHDFLGLAPIGLEQYDQRNVGAYDVMPAATRQRLQDYFAPHNQRLYDLLDWNLGWDDA